MAGIIDDGDIGALGILDEVVERPEQLPCIAIGDDGGFETEPGKKVLDGAGIAGGIGERREVLVRRLADDQRHPPHGLVLGTRRKNKNT